MISLGFAQKMIVLFLGERVLPENLVVLKNVLKLDSADLLIVRLPPPVPVLALVELIRVRDDHEYSERQEGHEHEAKEHRDAKVPSHFGIFPLDQVLVLLEVITVHVDEVQSVRDAPVEVLKFNDVVLLVSNIIVSLDLFYVLD